MGYRLGGRCYADWDAAVDGFITSYPRLENGNTFSLVSSTPVPFNMSISYQLVSGTGTPSNGAVYLAPCTETMDSWPLATWLLIFALFFASMIGFHTGLRFR